jgi:gamma-glutamyltranspeptidase/glutathione hydrolase
LAEHRSEWVEPVSTSYRGYDVWELPPNGQGIAVLQMLNILEGFDLRSMGHNSASYLHHLIEAKKLAFEDRARYYADPAFSPIPVAELISKPYAAARRALLDSRRAAKAYPAGDPLHEKGDTIYLTVADSDRNMVSLIQSNFMGFGSGLVPDGTGFGLQDRGALFTLEEGHFNTYAPGKRPFHTIIPAFVTRDGRPFLSFGVMGGDMQPQGHVQVLCNIIDFGMTIQEAGDAPRFRHFGSSDPTGGKPMEDGGAVAVETGVPAESIRGLIQMGHQVRFDVGSFGGYQAILYDPVQDVYWGASESRKDGMAAGY